MASSPTALEERLLGLLTELAAWPVDQQGYAPANLVTLLGLHRGHLRDLNLARLALREVDLRGMEMQGTSLAEATLQESVFTETFDAITGIAISPTGAEWAAIGRRGEIRLWKAGGQNSSPHLARPLGTSLVACLQPGWSIY